MKKIDNFIKDKMEASFLYNITGGRYKKSGCGTREVGDCTMSYKCDIVDEGGSRPTIYYGGKIVC